ncbi:MAG: DUF3088 domain-containing protein [Pseudomonadota bacterium]
MTRDVLFLLAPGFEEPEASGGPRREFCPECAEIWGVLSYFPAIKEALDIHYQPLARPRADMAAMLGEEHQNCPTLVLAPGADAGESANVKTSGDYRFLDNARDIAKYFNHRYGTPWPRNS